jgi:hypothetical protein
MKGVLVLLIAATLITFGAMLLLANSATRQSRPTAESARAADELTKALRDDDPDGIARLLSDDWFVISARGEEGEGKMIFPNAISRVT